MTKPTNIYLFYGEDDFSLRRKVDIWKTEFAKKYSPQAISFFDGTEMGETDLIRALQDNFAPSLFSTKKLIIIRDGLPKKADQEKLVEFLLNLPSTVPKDYIVVFWQTSKPDGRLKFTKEFKNQVTVQEFELPHGPALNSWIKAMAKNINVTITDQAAETLAVYLGRDLYEEKKAGGRVIERKEAYNLWEVYSELSKLASHSSNIEPDAIEALVKPKVSDSVFKLSDNLASGNRKMAFESLNNYLSSASGDEKSAFIKVIGLLAEQFRSILLVSLLQTQGMDNSGIAEKLGWSTGRVFMVSKHTKNFSESQIKRFLANLLNIDRKIKSSDANPRLLMDQFLAQT